MITLRKENEKKKKFCLYVCACIINILGINHFESHLSSRKTITFAAYILRLQVIKKSYLTIKSEWLRTVIHLQNKQNQNRETTRHKEVSNEVATDVTASSNMF